MDRRDFLIRVGGMTIVVASVGYLGACSDDGDNPTATQQSCPAGTASGSAIDYTNTDPGHKHTATLTQADIDTPPSGGKVITVSPSSGHSHTINLSRADFQSIKDGNKVNKASSTNSGHSHAYCLWRA